LSGGDRAEAKYWLHPVAVARPGDWITATFQDGRRVSVPLWWSWRLEAASAEQRRRYEIFGGGTVVHWPEVDEDLSAQGFFLGAPAPRGQAYEAFMQKRGA
jgi:hypothetical protein